MRRLFLLDGKLHPAWRVALYLALGFFGSFLAQVAVGVIYALTAALGLALTGGAPARLSQDLAAGNIPPPLLALLAFAGLIWALGITWAFRAWLDKAPLRDLGFARGAFGKEVMWGLLLGLAAMVAVLGAYLTLGWASIRMTTEAVGAWGVLVLMALALLPAAAAEEIIFRGYVLQTLMAWRGWGLGLVVSSLSFGLAHFLNPDFGVLAFLNIALAGVAFGLMYRVTRRLWLPMAGHFMWNYAQGPLFGFPVSGLDFQTLATTTVAGPALWTGGEFGPEGGLVATLVLLALCGIFYFYPSL